MKVEFSMCSFDNILLGLMTARGQDEDGEFITLSLGLLFFEVSWYWY